MSDAGDEIRVLYVDDDPDVADLTATALERADDRFVVETVPDTETALGRLDDDVDCVVSEYDMPDRTGVEFLCLVRERVPGLPFVLFTDTGSESVASEAISAGVTDYLRKDAHADGAAILANRIGNAVDGHRAERERRRHLDAIETAQEGIAILDDEEFVYVNEAYASLYGYDPDDLVGERWEQVYPDDETAVIHEEVLPTVRADGQWHGETTGLRADGSTFVEDHRLATTDRGELVCSVRDVSDRRERTRQFEAVFDNTYTFTGLLDPDGTVREANETALEFGGVDREAVVGKRLWETCWFAASETARSTVRKAVQQARSGDLFRDEVRIQGTDRAVVIDFSIRPITDEAGTVTSLVPEGREITDRKQRERELRRSERRLEAVFEDPKMLVGVLSPDGRLRKANRTAMELIDADHEEVVGEPFWETPWWPGDDRAAVREWVERAADGEYVEYESDHVNSGPERRSVSGTIRPVTDESGAVVSLIASARDTTERREHRRALRRRNERLDEFASVVSHDLRNPLNVATGHLSVAQRQVESAHLDETAHALERMEDLIEDLLTLAKADDRVADFESVDLAAVARDCWRNVSSPGTTLRVEAEGTINADRSQLQQLLENLFRNSVEHSSTDSRSRTGDSVEHGATSNRTQSGDSVEHGSTGSRTGSDDSVEHGSTSNRTQSGDSAGSDSADRRPEADGGSSTITVGELPDGFYVADDGPGIPEAEREQVFESGYSTDEDGTGFGLSIVSKIAEGHGWTVSVAESERAGTRIEIGGVTRPNDRHPSA
ncbi:PAS domain-containing protein [Haloplanus ruber]|nr:PAS domain-containing protein [Haloplanus ruber]